MSKHKKTRWGRVATAWILSAAFVFAIVPYKKLPEQVRGNVVVSKAYELKDKWTGGSAEKAAAVEPAAGEPGYKAQDRRELDSLISRGNYDE